MSDIDSKKDNSIKIGDYGDYVKKLGSSIIKFCILILLGCLILYASKACGSGVLDIIISKYYVKGLTDTMLFKPNECSTSTPEINATENEQQPLNTQYINRIKGDDNKSLYQKLFFSYNSENKDILSSLHHQLDEIKKNPTKEKIHFYQLYQLFINGIISNVSIFNLTFLNSYFKFLNNNFSDSATIIFGPVISVIILLIISTMSMFVTAYYVVYNAQWLALNTTNDINTYTKVNGVKIFYKSYKDLLFFPWLGWLGWCMIIGWIISISIFPLSMGITAFTLLKWLFFILILPSTCNDEPCDFFTMFVDSFKYKRPLISWIMSLMVISTSFDVFDTTGGTIAIIVFILVYFNFIKIGLFDKYVPTDADAFVPMDKVDDLIPKCITNYEDVEPKANENNNVSDAKYNAAEPGLVDTSVDATTDAAKDVITKTTDAAINELNKTTDAATNAINTDIDAATDAIESKPTSDVLNGVTNDDNSVEMVNIKSTTKDAINTAADASTDAIESKPTSDVLNGDIEMVKSK